MHKDFQSYLIIRCKIYALWLHSNTDILNATNFTLQNGQNGKFYFMYILPQ